MTDYVLRLKDVGKHYYLGGLDPYNTLRDKISALFTRTETSKPPKKTTSFWALRDIAFDLQQGEVLGIVGRNGAGKSTLLKLLSRITTPDEGTIEVNGRVGSLLEVGTGFHPELTGRENVFMNGILLGMSRKEVTQKFDEIVAFSGVEEFLDTPVKRYSSGMRVRLGFAVAAHLSPDVLIVDEVLAVGDAQFQKKCLGRMNEVANEGRTVIFVSHQLESVANLCSRVLWMHQGRIVEDGQTDNVVRNYMNSVRDEASKFAVTQRPDRQGNQTLRVTDIYFSNSLTSEEKISVVTGGNVSVNLVYQTTDIGTDIVVNLYIRDELGRHLCSLTTDSVMSGRELRLTSKSGVLSCFIPRLPLTPGSYYIDYSIKMRGVMADKLQHAISFDIEPGDFFGTGRAVMGNGVFLCDHEWQVRT